MAKKTTAKRTAKKSPAKKSPAKPSAGRQKPVAKKSTGSARNPKPSAGRQATALKPSARRPDPNLPPSADRVNAITNELLLLIAAIDDYTANLRSLDRQRHNGVGIRRRGFIEAAFSLSTKFPQYFPHWLNTAKFQRDLDLFNAVRSLVDVCRSLEEKAWNINTEAADMVYTDALEYYSQVQDAADRRIDSAESIYLELRELFRNMGPHGTEDGAPTQKQAKKDFNAVMKGTKEGKVGAKNVKPKIIGGKREIIDETYKDSAAFKETEEGEITG